jgi:CheY-like chemotaxis protein
MDDNELVRGVLRAMLEALGHEVVDAVDGSACVLAYQEGLDNGRPIELVILDLTVPGGRGGVWAFEHLREIDPHVQAIVASGYGTDAVLAAPGAFGFQGRLQKPFEIEDLRKMVDGVLAGGPGGAG